MAQVPAKRGGVSLEPLIGPQRNFLIAAIIGWLVAYAGSLPIAYLLGELVPQMEGPDFGAFVGGGLMTVVIIAIITPFIETIILALTTSLLLKFMQPRFAILLSAFGWAIAHSYSAPIWGLVIAWPFIIFTSAYVFWKKKSVAWGFFMAFLIHALNNMIPSMTIGYPQMFGLPA